MKKSFAPATVAFVILLAALSGLDDGRAFAAARMIAPGDTLVYDITLDIQLHALGAKSSASMTSVRSGAGTETLSIRRVASDGTANAAFNLSYRGSVDGRQVRLDKTWQAQLSPDGEIHSVGGRPALGDDLEQALSYINGLTKGLHSRTLTSGAAWTTREPLGSSSGEMIIANKVAGVQPYEGFRAYVIDQSGSGAFTESVGGAPGVGSIAMDGTLYYDKANQLLIGGAARAQTEMALTNANITHISATTSVDVRLRSWKRAPAAKPASPAPGASAASATPSAEPAASGSGQPAAGPTPAYTPAPPATSTPSPISTGS